MPFAMSITQGNKNETNDKLSLANSHLRRISDHDSIDVYTSAEFYQVKN